MPKKRMKIVDAFAGMGGFSFALGSRYKTGLYCEISKKCHLVLNCLMRDNKIDKAPIYPDITTLNLKGFSKEPFMLTAGSPCTDLSSLTRSAVGIHGARSNLIFQVFRLIDENPNLRAVFLENSPMIIHRGLPEILAAFRLRGFKVAWGIFSAREVGAPHLRRRWYCLATKNVKLDPVEFDYQHDWTREPVPRIVPKNLASRKNLRERADILGNAVVPQTVAHAFNSLVAALQFSLPATKNKKNPLKNVYVYDHVDDRVQSLIRLTKAVEKPDVEITIDYEKDNFRHHAWATPVRNVRPSTCETERASQMLATQILHDRETLEYAKRLTGRHHDTGDMNAAFSISPLFVEWLMGYPFDWTQCAFDVSTLPSGK